MFYKPKKYHVLFVLVGSVVAILSTKIERRDILSYVIVHLDFKGAPPKLTYLTSLLKDLKDFGANGLLLEYEDAFPFQGVLQEISAKNGYNRRELSNFLKKAVQEGFTLIPFVQTSGHFQYIFKNKKYKKYTEKCYPNRLSSNSFLLREILQQIIQFHKHVAPLNFFHIGCDEILHTEKCDPCHISDYDDSDDDYDECASQRNSGAMKIDESHVIEISNFVHSISPKTTILVWDDMFREDMNHFSNALFYNIQPVSWLTQEVQPFERTLKNYKEYFQAIWAASAFKGADGQAAMFPDLSKRFDNHCNWIQVVNNTNLRYSVKGIILTGRSKHSHYSPFFELLTSSIPSLYLNLLLIQRFKNSIGQMSVDNLKNDTLVSLKNKLNCAIKDNVIDEKYYSDCRYNGSEVNSVLFYFNNPNNLNPPLSEIKYKLFEVMSSYFDNEVVFEYFHEKTKNL